MRFFTALAALTACAAAWPFDLDGGYKSSIELEARQSGAQGQLPNHFEWSSTGPLVCAKNDGRNISGIKDPSIVFYDGKYHVFASTAQASGYSLVYFSFKDFSKAGQAKFYYLDQSPIGTGYRAAPEVFYFEPQKLWYLVYQDGNAAYSTNPDINDPSGWTAPTSFYSRQPKIIKQNIGNGYWVDMWVICDETTCHLFSSDDNGHLYRSSTPLSKFPKGMTDTVIAKTDDHNNIYDLYEASNVYKIEGGGYLLIVEAIGSDGNRYFRSWTSPQLDGKWINLAATQQNPFARSNNVVFPGGAWTQSISHGEMIRDSYNQSLTISPCNIRYLYQGVNPADTNVTYNAIPWCLGLLTQTDSTC